MSLTVILSGCSLVIAAVALYSSRQAVHRTTGPTVWAVVSFGHEDRGSIDVRFHNGGPGIALDVRAARIEPNQPPPPDLRWKLFGQRWERTTGWDPTPRVRTLGPGEENPPDPGWHCIGFRPPEELNQPFWVALRYRDTAGRPWELTVPYQQSEPAHDPRRLRRSGRLCRWQRWRASDEDW